MPSGVLRCTMSRHVLTPALRASVVDGALLTAVRGLAVVAFLAIGVVAVHLLVGAFRAEHGRLRDREARLVVVAAGVVFVAGFARLAVADGADHGSLAGVALGFTAIAYLPYLARPVPFELPADDGTAENADTEPAH
jgi:hypothetical protein